MTPFPSPLSGDTARIATEIGALTAATSQASGALWKLAEPGRQLDANVVRLLPGQQVKHHVEPDLDVLLLVTCGDGTLHSDDGAQQLAEGSLLWLPRGSARALHAGDHGLIYLTAHRRRPGMQIRRFRDG